MIKYQFNRFLMFFSLLCLFACTSNPHKNIDLTNKSFAQLEAGTIVHQRSKKLEYGFFEVNRSQINPKGHWEGIGHFSFVYFGDKKLCQCSGYEVVISPKGRYAVYYSNQKRTLELFDTRTGRVEVLSEKYIGYPKSGIWDFDKKIAIIKLYHPNGDKGSEIKISLT